MRLAFALLLCAGPAAAEIFITRHADKRDAKDDASTLSARGLRRAQDLRRVLSSVPLKAVYCTEYVRSAQTAAPVAKSHGLTPIVTPYDDLAGLVKALRTRPAREDVLVVGHSDTIPDLLKGLGVAEAVAIASDDYDDLFIVAPSSGAAGFHRLHYGAAPTGPKR